MKINFLVGSEKSVRHNIHFAHSSLRINMVTFESRITHVREQREKTFNIQLRKCERCNKCRYRYNVSVISIIIYYNCSISSTNFIKWSCAGTSTELSSTSKKFSSTFVYPYPRSTRTVPSSTFLVLEDDVPVLVPVYSRINTRDRYCISRFIPS